MKAVAVVIDDNPEEEDPTKKSRMTELSELGLVLPVGVPDSAGGVNRSMEMKDWSLDDEIKLGKLRQEHKKLGLSGYVSLVVGTMYRRLGPHVFDDTTTAEQKRLTVGQMHIGDVLYAYVLLRAKAVSDELKINLGCGRCDARFSLLADLNTMDITVYDDPADVAWEYELYKPIKIGDRVIEKLTMREPVWEAMRAVNDEGAHVGAAKQHVLESAIVGDAGDGRGLSSVDVGRMGKRDVELILREINDRSSGPDMSVREKCPKCRAPVITVIDWGYDSFFGASSL